MTQLYASSWENTWTLSGGVWWGRIDNKENVGRTQYNGVLDLMVNDSAELDHTRGYVNIGYGWASFYADSEGWSHGVDSTTHKAYSGYTQLYGSWEDVMTISSASLNGRPGSFTGIIRLAGAAWASPPSAWVDSLATWSWELAGSWAGTALGDSLPLYRAYNIPFTYGQPFVFSGGLGASCFSRVNSVSTEGSWAAFVNLANTLTWEGITSVFDELSNPVTDYTLTSDSGTDWSKPIQAPPIPIPSAVWLIGSGLIGLAGLRRKLRVQS